MTAPILLNTAMIRCRRLELRLSARVLEHRLGVGGGWVHSLESGRNHAHITLTEVHTLAESLGVEPHELLAETTPPVTLDADHPDALRADVARLGRVLGDIDHQTHTTRLAAELGWTAGRLETALEILDANLRAAGQRLVRGGHGVQIARDTPTPDEAVEKIQSERISSNGLTPTQAAVLAKVLAGKLTERDTNKAVMREAPRVALATLVNAGLVNLPAVTRGSRYQVTERVRVSLLVDESAQQPASKQRREHT